MNQQTLKSTFPVLFGYIPLGMTFGMLFQDLGYAWYFATLMAIVVYAGAAQFMIIGLLLAGAGLLEIFVAILLLNSRHIFYGLSLLKKYGQWDLKKMYLTFGLTDETYSLVTTINPPKDANPKDCYFTITALNHSYWIIGCTLGAWVGSSFQINTEGMDFALTALFVVLLIEQWKKIKEPLPFVIATISSAVAIIIFSDQMLLVSILLSIIVLMLAKLTKANSP